MNRPAVPARSLAAEQLSQTFTGSAPERVKRARLVATQLERLLERIDAGEVGASPTEVARLEGADLALRAISRTRLDALAIRRDPAALRAHDRRQVQLRPPKGCELASGYPVT